MKDKKITGYHLKMIALVTMLIDHVAAVILATAVYDDVVLTWVTEENRGLWQIIVLLLRGVGRMAFPIYCFLLIEGFLHTRNVKKYFLRLVMFACLSEIPFDICFRVNFITRQNFYSLFRGETDFWSWLHWLNGYNNVFFTLAIGLFAIYLISQIRQKNGMLSKIGVILVTLASMLVAEYVFHCDYGMAGVLAIVMMYQFWYNRTYAFIVGVVVLAVLVGWLEVLALFMLIPLHYYNGERGKQAKYVFYGFYPVHLLILAVICLQLGYR